MKIIWDNIESSAPLQTIEEAPIVIEEDIQEDYEDQAAPAYQGGTGFGIYY